MSRYPWQTRTASSLIGSLAVALLLSGCDKEDKIVIENSLPLQENRAPSIITYSPEFTSEGLEVMSSYAYGTTGLPMTVIVGDPDGVDDIAAVTMDIDSVVLHRFVMRADTSTSYCPGFSYAAGDTVPNQQILATPASFPGVSLRPLTNAQGGIYLVDPFGGYGSGFPNIYSVASYLQLWSGGCSPNDPAYAYWVVQPPVLAAPRLALLTYLDVEYIGTRITVWDQSGASAVLSLPNVRVVYTTEKEKRAAS